jgi:hypothetical protein
VARRGRWRPDPTKPRTEVTTMELTKIVMNNDNGNNNPALRIDVRPSFRIDVRPSFNNKSNNNANRAN